MKKIIVLIAFVMVLLDLQGCAVYPPYGPSGGYRYPQNIYYGGGHHHHHHGWGGGNGWHGDDHRGWRGGYGYR